MAVDSSSGAVLWRIRPDGRAVSKLLKIPDSSDCIVLLDPGEGRSSIANLIRVRYDGTTVWRASPPEPEVNDSWIDIGWGGGGYELFVANSWSGFAAVLSADSGVIVDKEFTK